MFSQTAFAILMIAFAWIATFLLFRFYRPKDFAGELLGFLSLTIIGVVVVMMTSSITGAKPSDAGTYILGIAISRGLQNMTRRNSALPHTPFKRFVTAHHTLFFWSAAATAMVVTGLIWHFTWSD